MSQGSWGSLLPPRQWSPRAVGALRPLGNGFFPSLMLLRGSRWLSCPSSSWLLLRWLRFQLELCQTPGQRRGERTKGGDTHTHAALLPGCAGLAAPSASASADPPARTPRWASAGRARGGWQACGGSSPPITPGAPPRISLPVAPGEASGVMGRTRGVRAHRVMGGGQPK